jgi:hypothetical protein
VADVLSPHTFSARPRSDERLAVVETPPTGGRLPDGVIAWDDYLAAFAATDPDHPPAVSRGLANSAGHKIARYRGLERIDDGYAGAPAVPADNQVIKYVTDPNTGAEHKVIDLHEARAILATGANIHGLGVVGCRGLERVLEAYLPTEAQRAAEAATRPPEHLTKQEIKALFPSKTAGEVALRVIHNIARHEDYYADKGIYTAPESSIFEVRYKPQRGYDPTIYNIANLARYLSPEHYEPGQIRRVGPDSAASIYPILQAYLTKQQ